jgi:hypothetical protein
MWVARQDLRVGPIFDFLLRQSLSNTKSHIHTVPLQMATILAAYKAAYKSNSTLDNLKSLRVIFPLPP